MATTLQPGEITQYNGREVKVLANGALLDTQSKQIVGNAPDFAGSTVISSSERARELNYIRWHQPAQDAYLKKLNEAKQQRGEGMVETIEAAKGAALAILAEEIVYNPDARGDHRIKAHEHILEQAGMDSRPPKQAQQQAAGIQLSIGADVAAEFMQRLMDRAQQRGLMDE